MSYAGDITDCGPCGLAGSVGQRRRAVDRHLTLARRAINASPQPTRHSFVDAQVDANIQDERHADACSHHGAVRPDWVICRRRTHCQLRWPAQREGQRIYPPLTIPACPIGECARRVFTVGVAAQIRGFGRCTWVHWLFEYLETTCHGLRAWHGQPLQQPGRDNAFERPGTTAADTSALVPGTTI